MITIARRDGRPLRIGHRGAARSRPRTRCARFVRRSRRASISIEFDVVAARAASSWSRIRERRTSTAEHAARSTRRCAFFVDEAPDVGAHVDLKLTESRARRRRALRRHDLVERSFVSSATSRYGACGRGEHDAATSARASRSRGGVLRITEHGSRRTDRACRGSARPAPVHAVRSSRPLLALTRAHGARAPPLARDVGQRPGRARARRRSRDVDRRRSSRPRARRRRGSRRGRYERSTHIRVYTGTRERDPVGSHAGRGASGRLRPRRICSSFRARRDGGRRNGAPQTTEPPTTTPPTEPPPTEPPVRAAAAHPAPIAFGVTVGGVRVGGLMPYQARESRREGVRPSPRTSSSTRRRQSTSCRLPLGATRELPEGDSSSALRPSGCGRPARRRRLAGARSGLRRPSWWPCRPGGT